MKNIIYLDYNSTTPVDNEVKNEIIACMNDFYANPSSSNHILGMKAQFKLENCREEIAKILGGKKEHIFFTSGASEANNLVFRGIIDNFYNDKDIHIITSKIEHKCILNCCKYLERLGIKVSYLNVSKDGIISIDGLQKLITKKTKLISIMAANNETGVLQPFKEVSKIAKDNNVYFHVDAAQYVGKLPFSISDIQADFLSISSHKFYGPKGIGLLYCSYPEIFKKNPLIYGGGQELGVRGGTVNLPAISGMTKAASIMHARIKKDSVIQKEMKIKFIAYLKSRIRNVFINGHETISLPNTINFSILNTKSKDILAYLKNDIAFSIGSACSSNINQKSHVLTAMGINDSIAESSIRLSFGRQTELKDLLYSVNLLEHAIKKLYKYAY